MDDGSAVSLVAVEEPFEAFYRRELPRLVALAAALAGPDGAEDIAQEALLRAHREWDRIARYDKPGAWVRQVALHLLASAARRRRTERRAMDRLRAHRPPVVLAPEVDGFWAMVRTLPTRQATAVALYYLEDRSVADIAEVLDCAPGTAKVHLHRGRTALAATLAAQEAAR